MIRHSLATLPSPDACLALIESLSARFVKDHQRKPLIDLLISSTYPAIDAAPQVARPGYVVKASPIPVVIHEVTLMVSDKTQREVDSTRLASEVSWFRAQGGVS